MNLLNDLKIGLQAFSKAYGFICIHKLRHYFIYPMILSILYWVGGYQIISGITQWASDHIHGQLDLTPQVVEEGSFSFFWSAVESMKGFYNDGYTVVLSFLVRIVIWILLLLVSKYVLLAILSPVLALLSERSEELVTGHKNPFNLFQFLRDISRGMFVAFRNLIAELSMLSLLWISTFIVPILAPVTVVLAFLISSFYYGFSMLDYINERERKGLKESFRDMRAHRGLAIALGLGIAAGMAIPVFGFIIASFVSILGAVAAVLAQKPTPYALPSEHEKPLPHHV